MSIRRIADSGTEETPIAMILNVGGEEISRKERLMRKTGKKETFL
jgi:hypothetical protein